jgi:hypothetical protein
MAPIETPHVSEPLEAEYARQANHRRQRDGAPTGDAGGSAKRNLLGMLDGVVGDVRQNCAAAGHETVEAGAQLREIARRR